MVSGVSWDATFLRRLVDGHDSIPGLTDLCTQEVGSGDASILHERNRYRDRSDLPSGQPVRLWTLDSSLGAHAGT